MSSVLEYGDINNREKSHEHSQFPCAVICVATLQQLACSNLCADDSWSRFRGPNGSGVCASKSLPAEFDAQKNLVWKTPLPEGHSSPVIRSGKIFLTAAEDENLLTICIDQKTGREIWRQHPPRDRKEKIDFRNHPGGCFASR